MKQLFLLSKSLIVGLFLLLGLSAKAATFYVRPFGNSTAWNNVSGANIKTLLTGNVISTFSSIDAAASGSDTYYFAPGTYNINVTFVLTTGKIYGGFSGDETSTADLTVRSTSDLDVNGIVEPWEFTNVVTFTTTAANGTYGGSGFANRIMTVTGGEVNGLTFFDYNNSVGIGAIILGSVTSSPTDALNIPANAGALKYCTIRKLKTTGFSGIVMMTNSASVVDKCLIEDCRVTTDGGAVYMNRMGGIVSNSVLRNNIAGRHGGAISLDVTAGANYTGTLQAAFSAIVSNCAIYNNTSTSNGGAIRGVATTTSAKGLEVVNCTVVNNSTGAVAPSASIELVNSGVIANSIVLSDTKSEIRPNTPTNYVVSTIYGANGGSTLYTATNSVSGIADLTFTAINFTRATATQGAVGNVGEGGYNSTTHNQIKAANYTITSASSSAVTTTSATLPGTYPNNGNVSSTANITIKATVPSLDMSSVTRTGNFTLGAYQFGASVTWNGTSWSNDNLGPNATIDAIIDGTYSNSAFNAKKLTVNSSKSFTLTSGNMTIQNEVINNGTFAINNNANLIQAGTTNSNTGNITVNRNSSALKRLDYTLWSSPVSGSQTLAQFSPSTSQNPNQFWTYDAASNKFANIAVASTFSAGSGYLIRMPHTASTTIAAAYAGQFTGIPNNGTITLSGLTAGQFYSVGNPYPSPLSAALFLSGNTTVGTLYFWRKTNGAVGSAYATHNGTGGVASTAGSEIPNGTIQVGQGFIVKTSGTSLSFTNTMREIAPSSTQFFKTKKLVEKSRVWLNLTTTGGLFSQALVGYLEGATVGVDNGYDGKYINDSATALTSIVDGEEYTIQGRPAFDVTDVVALGFKTELAGDFTIAMGSKDGVFAAAQDIYLVDSKTGIETDIKAGSYTFAADAGIDNARFSLKYQKTLKVVAPTFDENNVKVYKNNGIIVVNSAAKTIKTIEVYDVQGRLVAKQINVNASTATISNLKAVRQMLIVKVSADDNSVVSKKVLN